MKKILILGAGFGGLETASGLAEVLTDGYEVTLLDKSDSFFVGFSKIDVMFARRSEEQVRSPYAKLRARGVRFVQTTVTAVDTDAKSVSTTSGAFAYDYLVIALGADVDNDATPGFKESGGHEFYTMAGARRLGPIVDAFTKGTLVLGVLGAPYKCPPAPYEVAYQWHERFVARGVRDQITLKMVIPSPRPVPSPGVSTALEQFLAERNIELLAASPITGIDVAQKQVQRAAGAVPYDLFVGVPVHVLPSALRSCKLGGSSLGGKGYIEVSPTNLETKIPGVYAVGDVSKVPAGELVVPKAGAFAEDGARTVVSDILMREGRGSALTRFEARGVCYFELGGGQIAKVNANFLGGEKPMMSVEGPSSEFGAQKAEFEASRRARWFS